MNTNQIVNMVIRIIMRKVIHGGINAGIGAASGFGRKNKSPGDQTDAPPQLSQAQREQQLQAQKMAKVTRRVTRL